MPGSAAERSADRVEHPAPARVQPAYKPQFLILCLLLLPAACSDAQSALSPAGEEAKQVARLFWVMASGGAVIWAGVLALAIYALRAGRAIPAERAAARLILWGGAVFPTAVLLALLAYALLLMPSLRPFPSASAAAALRVEVTGHQYWWDVVYALPDGSSVRAANEIVIPVGQRVEFALKSNDVIHSFWIPPLAGKMDMIPGRTNRLSVLATREGRYRGPCAEFCGTSHTYMNFDVAVVSADEFGRWLAGQGAGTAPPDAPGRRLFIRHGCGACHRVAGTEAAGTLGPDLSRVGARRTVGAGLLANTEGNLARFIADAPAVKPGARMPAFSMLPEGDIRAIAVWLKGLE